MIVIWHLGWWFRFAKALPDTDFGQLAYYGFFAVKERDPRFLLERAKILGFKYGIYYLYGFAYWIWEKWYAPRGLFAAWNATASLVLAVFCLEPGGIWIGLFAYLILSTWPGLGALYLQGEFWALLPSLCLMALSMGGDFPGRALLLGTMVFVNPIFIKPTYIFESIVYLLWFDGSLVQALFTVGIVAGVGVVFAFRSKSGSSTRQFIFSKGFLTYFLKYNRKYSVRARALMTFKREFFSIYFLVAFYGFTGGDLFLLSLIVANSLAIVFQFRLYRYHFVPLIPVIAVLSSRMPPHLGMLGLLIPLISYIQQFFAHDMVALDKLLNEKIRHYHHRNIVSMKLAAWIEANTPADEPILVVGDTPQLHILSGRKSSCYYLNFEPHASEVSPDLTNSLLMRVKKHPPYHIILLMDCIHWRYIEARTGYTFQKCHEVFFNDEVFPVYRLTGKRKPHDEKMKGSLFVPCRTVLKGERKIWNSVESYPESGFAQK